MPEGPRKAYLTAELGINFYSSPNLLSVDDGTVIRPVVSWHFFPKVSNDEVKHGFNGAGFIGDESIIAFGYSRQSRICENIAETVDIDLTLPISNHTNFVQGGATEFGPLFRLNLDRIAEDGLPKGLGISFYVVWLPEISSYYNPVNGSVIGTTVRYSFGMGH